MHVISYPCPNLFQLTHWGRVTHICVSKLTIIGSDNGLSPERRQAIIWTNAGILLIWPLGANFSEMSIEIPTFSFKKIHLKMSSGKWRPFCLGLNVLKRHQHQEPWRRIPPLLSAHTASVAPRVLDSVSQLIPNEELLNIISYEGHVDDVIVFN